MPAPVRSSTDEKVRSFTKLLPAPAQPGRSVFLKIYIEKNQAQLFSKKGKKNSENYDEEENLSPPPQSPVLTASPLHLVVVISAAVVVVANNVVVAAAAFPCLPAASAPLL